MTLRTPSRNVIAIISAVAIALILASSGAVCDRALAEAGRDGGSLPPGTTVGRRLSELPIPVAEMRELILSAALSGEPEAMRDAVQWNELKPVFGTGPAADPIAWLKDKSADGTGHDVLAQIVNILAMPFALAPLGPDVENNRMYVFPAMAARDLKKLSARERVALFRLVPACDALGMINTGRYTGWAIAIGADGTWHSLTPAEPAKRVAASTSPVEKKTDTCQ